MLAVLLDAEKGWFRHPVGPMNRSVVPAFSRKLYCYFITTLSATTAT